MKVWLHVCGCTASTPVSCVSGRQSETLRGFHILTFVQIFAGYQEKRKRELRGEKKEVQERDRGGLEPQTLLLLASSQRFFFETRGQANRVSLPLTSASSSIKHNHIHRNPVCPKAPLSANEADRQSTPVRWSYRCLAKTEDRPNPVNMRWKSALLFLLLETPRNLWINSEPCKS